MEVNANTIAFTTPAYVSGSLVKDVVATNSSGSATLTAAFTYTAIAPAIMSISPNTGPVSGGTNVTITGSGFTPGTTVTIGGSLALGVTIVNANTLTAVTPAYVNGPLAANVMVNNGISNAVLTGGFTYQPLNPAILTVTPNNGPTSGGTLVTITGLNFTPSTTVSIGGIAANTVTLVNASTITAVTPTYISGSLIKDVVVSNEVGTATLPNSYIYTAPIPTITHVSPNSGSTGGGTALTVTGSGFTPSTTLTIGGIAATNIVVTNSTTLTAVTPIYVSGSLVKDVTVNNGVGSATLAAGFTYVATAPTLTTISPSTGPTAGGTAVTLTGTNFTPTTTVTVGGVFASAVTVVNSTTITAVTPPYASGALGADVVVNNGAATATLPAGFTYQPSTPTLVSVTPNAGSITGGASLVLTGTNFTPTSTVTIGGIAAMNVMIVNSTSATLTVPSYVSGSLVKDVVLNNGVGSATLTNGFTYVATAPTLSTVTPNTGPVAGNTSITISGTGFTPNTTVSIGGVAATSVTVTNATTLTATTPAYISGSLVKGVTVNNGVSSATLTGGFTYTATTPTLTSVTPSSGSIAGGTMVTLSGTGFIPGTTVTIGGNAAIGVNVINATTLTALTPAHASGAVNVSISNGAGTATLTGGFTYQLLAPTILNVTPSTGGVGGGTNITVTGTNLTGITSVLIGGVAATNVVVVSDTSVTATTPAYVSGSLVADVTVSNGSANATLPASFTYLAAAPTAGFITPATGTIAGGTNVTLTGSGFTPTTTVTVGGIAATNVVQVNANTLLFTTPAYFSGPLVKNVVVTNSVGSSTLTAAFTYTPIAPTITAINPNTGPVAGGTSVTITGSGFTPGTTVTIGGLSATGVTITNANSLTAVTPPYFIGSLAANVVVNNGVSNAVLTGGFTYLPATPTITGITPNSGSMDGGTLITVTGTNFTPLTAVSIGGITTLSVTIINSTTLTTLTPAYFSGSLVKDVVVNNGIGTATLTNGYTYLAVAPILTSITPIIGTTAGGTTITLTGGNFTPTTTVTIGGVSATSVVVNNTTTLTAVTPAYVSGLLIKDVVINNGNANAILLGGFTYVPANPTLISITPTSGTTNGGTTITLTGTAFTPLTTVTIGGVNALNVMVINATTLTATTPIYLLGSLAKTVSVNNGVGSASLLNAFTYVPAPPTILSITPNIGTFSGEVSRMFASTSVTVVGTNFVPGTTLTIGGVATNSISVVNSTSITALTPGYLTGPLTQDVTVNNGAGIATLLNGYTYNVVEPNLTSCTYPGGILSTSWVCVGTNLNVFPNTYLNVQGGLTCSIASVTTLLTTTISTLTNIGANSLLPGLYNGCAVQLCNNSTCTGLKSNILLFS